MELTSSVNGRSLPRTPSRSVFSRGWAALDDDEEGASGKQARPPLYSQASWSDRKHAETNNGAAVDATCVIKEASAFKERWDVLVVLCILYSAFVVPLRICFRAEAEGAVWAFEMVVTLVFCADLTLNFHTAFLRDGEWVTDKPSIARNYLQGWFWVDAPASVPVELIALALPAVHAARGGEAPPDSGALAVFRILRLLRLVRMLRLLQIGAYLSRLEDHFDVSLRPFRVVQLLAQMLFVAHMLACGWFLTTWIDGVDEPKWIDLYDEGSAADGPVRRQYYFSFWWSITTLFAVNPIPQITDTERDFMIGVNLFNRLFFAYVVGNISSLISQFDRQAAMIRDKIDLLKEYLQWRSIPRELAFRVKRYYEYYYRRQAVYDERTILSGLNPSLKQELVVANCRGTLGRIPLFRKLSIDFLSEVFPLAKPQSFIQGETIFAQGTVANELHFILDGEVDLLSDADGFTPEYRIRADSEALLSLDEHGDELVEKRGPGCGSFGQEVLVGERRRCTAVAYSTSVESFIVERADLLRLFSRKELTVDLRRVCRELLDDFMARDRMRSVKIKMRMGKIFSLPSLTDEERAGLRLLDSWRLYRRRRAQEHDALFKLINTIVKGEPFKHKDKPSVLGGGSPGAGGGWAECSMAIDQLTRKQEHLQANVDELLQGMARLLANAAPPTDRKNRSGKD